MINPRVIAILAALSTCVLGMDVAAIAAEPAEQMVIDGYRGAKFGMSDKEVRGAIKKDFDIRDPADDVNDVERTKVLTITVKALLPDAPPAQISYILGASSSKLMQVNVVWGGEPGGGELRQLVSVANTLRGYFIDRGGYAEGSTVVNKTLADGSVLVFRGADAKGHMVVLHLLPIVQPTAGESKGSPPAATKGVLRLSYVEQPGKPDVFHIEKGQF